MCKRPNSFGVFLDVDPSHLSLGLPYASRSLVFTFHYPIEALYKEPFGYIEGGEIEEQENYSPLLLELILESASLCPLEHFVFFSSLPLLMSLLSRDGGLKWWRTQFLGFEEVSTEVVTIVSQFLLI